MSKPKWAWMFFLLQLSCAFALTTDRDKPIYLEADSAEINHKNGHGIYQNNVKVSQGSTHIHAHKAQTYFDNFDSFTEAVFEGNTKKPVHFWTIPAKNKEALHAYAKTIKLYPKKDLIVLMGNAKVTQGDDSYSAPHIEYNLKSDSVSSPPKKGGKTVIILKHKQENPI